MLNLLSGLLGGKGGALKTISSVIDDLHTSEEEKLDKKIHWGTDKEVHKGGDFFKAETCD